MSLSWNKRLRIVVAPDRLRLHKTGLPDTHDETIECPGGDADWREALERLGTILDQPEWQGKEADILLSNKLVRYARLTFDAQLKDSSAQEAYARYSLTRTYGAVAAQWELRIQRGKAGEPWLVCATDKALLEQLGRFCVSRKIRLRSVMPGLIPVFNRHAGLFSAEPGWLAMHEPGYTLLALLHEGSIVTLSGVRHDSIEELPMLLDRENLLLSLEVPCKRVYLHLPFGGELPALEGSGYEIRKLDMPEPQAKPALFARLHSLLSNRSRKHALKLDFQRTAGGGNRLAGWALLLTGLALLAEMGYSYDKLQQERAAMSRAMGAGLQAQAMRERQPARKYTEDDFEKARQIVGRLSTSWGDLFTALESVSNEHAAILSVEPDTQAGSLRLEGEARDYASALTLVAQLRTIKPFSEVFLSRHEIKRDDPQHPVGFTLSLRWGSAS